MKTKKNWCVRLKCTVIKEIYCTDCTKEEAEAHPWDFSDGDELEINQEDWEVLDIKENN